MRLFFMPKKGVTALAETEKVQIYEVHGEGLPL
nr:MAG TPA: hypothetical protein [Bacteriophage sp.]